MAGQQRGVEQQTDLAEVRRFLPCTLSSQAQHTDDDDLVAHNDDDTGRMRVMCSTASSTFLLCGSAGGVMLMAANVPRYNHAFISGR